jgi:hypothetical protein
LNRLDSDNAELAATQLTESDFDVRDQELQKPIVFRASFNRFEHINLSQAWSLWLSGCRDDGLLGVNPASGWFLTLCLLSALVLIALEHLSLDWL